MTYQLGYPRGIFPESPFAYGSMLKLMKGEICLRLFEGGGEDTA